MATEPNSNASFLYFEVTKQFPQPHFPKNSEVPCQGTAPSNLSERDPESQAIVKVGFQESFEGEWALKKNRD